MHLNLLEQLKTSNIGKQLEADFQSETLKKRQAAAAEIKRIVAHLTKVLPGLLEAREKAEADVEAGQKTLQKARQAFDRAHGVVHNARVRADARRHQQEQILRASYPAEIDEFKAEMNRLLELTRSKGIDHRDHGRRSIVNDKWQPEVYSNVQAAHARLDYLRAAIRETEELKLQALAPEKLTARLEELRRKLPQTGVMQLVS